MTNGTRHDPCIPRHWAMRCPAWTLTRTSRNRVVNKIRPNTDVASISSVLHLVWPLAQSLSSMVVPTRSHYSNWHSLWDLGGTQAPQLRQSNNTLGGQGMGDVEGTFIIESIYPIISSEFFLPIHYSVLYKIWHLTSYNESIQRPMCCPTVNLYSEPWHHRVPSGSPVTGRIYV